MKTTVHQLLVAQSNDLKLYATPEAYSNAYWNGRPQWRDDILVATVSDFLQAAGYDSLDSCNCKDPDQCVHCSEECEIKFIVERDVFENLSDAATAARHCRARVFRFDWGKDGSPFADCVVLDFTEDSQ